MLNTLSQVVLAVVKVFYYAGPPSEHPKVIPPMLRLLHISTEVERAVLPNLLMVSQSLLVRDLSLLIRIKLNGNSIFWPLHTRIS